jgi:hypothetical protein
MKKIYLFKFTMNYAAAAAAAAAAATVDGCNLLLAFIDKDYRSRSSATYSDHLGSVI